MMGGWQAEEEGRAVGASERDSGSEAERPGKPPGDTGDGREGQVCNKRACLPRIETEQ